MQSNIFKVRKMFTQTFAQTISVDNFDCKMKRITIKDIATLLKIAPSTVSRALADHPDISMETKTKVQAVARSLNYSPNLKAKYLRSKLSGIIVLILPEINTFFTPELMNGVNQVVREKGYSLVIFQSDNSYEKERELLKYCVNLSAEGVLLSLSKGTSNLTHLAAVKEARIPLVLLDKTIHSDSFSSISINGVEASYQAVSYLLGKGRKQIVGVFGDKEMAITQSRIEGYRQALEAYGNLHEMIFEVKDVKNFEDDWERFSARHSQIDACFTMSDELLVRTHHAVMKRGLKIPEDIALFSISDGQAPYYLFPNISHLKHSGFEVGTSAGKLLFNLMSDLDSMILEAKLPIELIELSSV